MATLVEAFPDWLDPETGGIFSALNTLFSDTYPWLATDYIELDAEYFGNKSGEKSVSPIIDKFIAINEAAELLAPEELTATQVTALAKIINMRYKTQWGKLYAIMNSEYNPINNFDMTETETPDITHTRTPNITRTHTPNGVENTDTQTTKRDETVTTETAANAGIYGFNSSTPAPQAEGDGNSTVRTQSDPTNNIIENKHVEAGNTTDAETGTETDQETGTRTVLRLGNTGLKTQELIKSEIDLWKWTFYETVFADIDRVLTSPSYTFELT